LYGISHSIPVQLVNNRARCILNQLIEMRDSLLDNAFDKLFVKYSFPYDGGLSHDLLTLNQVVSLYYLIALD
jgi:hypothetical protein